MSRLGDNVISPLQIADAREAAYKASELQRKVEEDLKEASRDLAECERLYRMELSKRILELRAGNGDVPALPATVCKDVAGGEAEVARLRQDRDIAAGLFEAMKQAAFRRGADRRDLDTLLNWSMRRDLATQVPPPGFEGGAR